jgi:hypothetical protein
MKPEDRAGFDKWEKNFGSGLKANDFKAWEACCAHRDAQPAVAVDERLLRAAKKYFMGYCRDEASEFGSDDTGCTQKQHKDALELGEAIAAAEAAKAVKGGVL